MKFKFLVLILIIVFLTSCAFEDYIKGEEGVSYIPIEEIPVEEEIEESPLEEVEEAIIEEELEELIEELEEIAKVEEIPSGAPKITVNEKELVKLNLKATDPDGDPLTYTYTEPLNEEGEWQTEEGDAGTYKVIVTVSDGKSETEQEVYIVVSPLNQPPIMETIGDIIVSEGETVSLAPKATDPNGDEVIISYSGWMTEAEYKTNYEDAGIHTVTIIASDGISETKQDVKVTVKNVNRAPIIASLSDVAIKEGEKVSITATAADPDKDEVSITYSEPLDKDGEWQTEEGDAGKYRVTITASDGEFSSQKSIFVVVESLNKAPVFEEMELITVDEGDTITLEPVATDPEGEEVIITYSGWMTSAEYTTDYDDAGEHTVTITASDGVNEATIDVKIVVNDVNRPPEFIFE